MFTNQDFLNAVYAEHGGVQVYPYPGGEEPLRMRLRSDIQGLDDIRISAHNESELLTNLREAYENFDVNERLLGVLSEYLRDADDVSSLDLVEEYAEAGGDIRFARKIDLDYDAFLADHEDDGNQLFVIESIIDTIQGQRESLYEMIDSIDKAMSASRSKFENQILAKSLNGDDLGLACAINHVPVSAELESLSHFLPYGEFDTMQNCVRLYRENPALLYGAVAGKFPDGMYDMTEIAKVSGDMYRSSLYSRLEAEFQKQHHFVPKVLPQIEQGLMNLYGGELVFGKDGVDNTCPMTDEQISEFVSKFDRKSVGLVKDSYNPTLITMCAMGVIQPNGITKDQREILSAYVQGRDAKNLYKISDTLNLSLARSGGKNTDYIDVLQHAQASANYLTKVDGRHVVTAAELSQEIKHGWMESEKELYEKKYCFSFALNRVDIPGADKVVEMNGLKAYILPADDLRNFTVGYDTSCCQHFGGAGENCVTAAVTRPNSGIFVIEKNGKVEAQAFVWAHQMQSKNGSFVLDSLAFDNIEFANDQNLNRHREVVKGYEHGMSLDTYRACKNTMDYEGILAAYIKELPIPNVYMGTGYNVMSSIGEAFTDRHTWDVARTMAVEAIGAMTYTDFGGDARVLKADGELLMQEQYRMTRETDKMVSAGLQEYDTKIQDMKNSVFHLEDISLVVDGTKQTPFSLVCDKQLIGEYDTPKIAGSSLIIEHPFPIPEVGIDAYNGGFGCGHWIDVGKVRVGEARLEIKPESGITTIVSNTLGGPLPNDDLRSISAPSVTDIRARSFSNYHALATIDFPNVTNIGADAFNNCKSLETAYLPKSEYIHPDAFSHCKNLKALYVGPNCDVDKLRQSPNFPDTVSIIRISGKSKGWEPPKEQHEKKAHDSDIDR